MPYDSPSDVRTWVLSMMDEPASGSDWLTEVDDAILRVHYDVQNRHPWWWNIVYPPAVFLTTDDITNRTLTIATAGTSVAGTLSSTVASDLDNYKIKPSGKNWAARITAHTAGEAGITLDAAPETIAAGTACVIFQDEYQLAADLGLFVDGLWRHDGHFVEFWSMERLLREYPDPPVGGDAPVAFARIDKRRIRLSHYPTAVRRFEYHYTKEEGAITAGGSTAFSIDRNWRWLVAHGALAEAYLMKSDKRAGLYQQSYERGIEAAIRYHQKVMGGLGTRQGGRIEGPYGA